MGLFSKAFSTGLLAASTAGQVSRDWIPASIMHGWTGGSSNVGVRVSEQSALLSSAVFACQRAISESFAILPRDIYQKTAGNGRRLASDHPTSKVLKKRANPKMSSYRFWELIQRTAIAKGNGYAELQLNDFGDVVAMWPLPPERVTPRTVTRKGELMAVYDIKLDNDKTITLTQDRILHIAGIGYDGEKGYPLLDFMINAVGIGQALDDYSAAFFKSGGGMGGYVTVPDSFDETKIRNQQKHYELLNGGLQNAHRFKFLYESSKFTAASVTPTDSQMLESKVFQIQEVARYHRMPLHKIQETSKATGYSSLEQFNIEFVQDTLMPWIVNAEEECDYKLFGEDEDFYVKFNVNAILRGDAASRSTYYRTMVFSSLMTPNEARGLEDLPPIDGGDERLVPLNMSIDGKIAGESDKSKDANERIED